MVIVMATSTEWKGSKAQHADTVTLPMKMSCTLAALKMELGESTPKGVVEIILGGKAEWDRIPIFILWVILEKKIRGPLAPNGH